MKKEKDAKKQKTFVKTETNLKALLNFSMETIILISNDGIIKTINNAGLKTFNLDEERTVGKNINDFLSPEDNKIHQRILNIIITSRKKLNIRYFHKNRWFDCLYTPIIEDGNHMEGIAIYARDITEEKKSSEILIKTINRLTTAEKMSHLGYWEWNLSNNKLFWSQEMFNIFEVKPEDFTPSYKKTLSFIHPQDIKHFQKAIKMVFNKFNKHVFFRIICPNGNIKHLQGNIISEQKSKTKNRLIFGTLIDITYQKKTEFELKKSKKKSERANQEKTKFLATASHDIRQPLHTMELLMNSLFETTLEAKPKEIVAKLSISLSNLSILIDNLLDASKIDIGRIVPRKIVFPVDIIKHSLVEEYQTVALQKNITIKNISSSANIYSDPIIFERILRNLISNAIKYTNNGKIIVGCRHNGDKLRIEVHDSGRGIAPERQKQIFKEFEQIREPETIKATGFGLGLYIVKSFAEIIKTEIKIKSKIGKGTCFYFDIEKI